MTCACSCPKRVHEHWRDGTDCGSCGRNVCPRYRRTWRGYPLHVWILAGLAALAVDVAIGWWIWVTGWQPWA